MAPNRHIDLLLLQLLQLPLLWWIVGALFIVYVVVAVVILTYTKDK